MPYKKCPDCACENGVRSKKCKNCGTKFAPKPLTDDGTPAKIKKPRSSMSIEQAATGTWVYDHTKGMPQIEVPPDITGKIDNGDIRTNIEYHGLGYCIFYYITHKQIEDKALAEKWEAARKAMLAVQDYLYG